MYNEAKFMPTAEVAVQGNASSLARLPVTNTSMYKDNTGLPAVAHLWPFSPS